MGCSLYLPAYWQVQRLNMGVEEVICHKSIEVAIIHDMACLMNIIKGVDLLLYGQERLGTCRDSWFCESDSPVLHPLHAPRVCLLSQHLCLLHLQQQQVQLTPQPPQADVSCFPDCCHILQVFGLLQHWYWPCSTIYVQRAIAGNPIPSCIQDIWILPWEVMLWAVEQKWVRILGVLSQHL